jgi:hypothetical protein
LKDTFSLRSFGAATTMMDDELTVKTSQPVICRARVLALSFLLSPRPGPTKPLLMEATKDGQDGELW